MRIKVKLFDEWCRFDSPGKDGWTDLKARYTRRYRAPGVDLSAMVKGNYPIALESDLVPLGVAMRIPSGFEAIVTPGSSSFMTHGFIQAGGPKVIGGGSGDVGDEWKLPILVLGGGEILGGSRICRFRIQPSQEASIWQRLRWLFMDKVEFEFVSASDSDGSGNTGGK